MKTNLFAKTLVVAIISAAGVTAAAQSTTTIQIPLHQNSFERMAGEDAARLNLINEAKRLNPALKSIPNLEIQMLRLEAKSAVGDVGVGLRINNQIVDTESVETDPDNFNTAYDFQRVELKNIDRSLVTEASLVIRRFSNARLQAVELILGQVQEPVVFGRYADDQIAQIGGAANTSETEGDIDAVRPADAVVSAIYDRYYHQDSDLLPTDGGVPSVPAVVAPVLTPSPVVVAPPVVVPAPVRVAPPPPVTPQCVRHKKRYDVCVGDTVKNRFGMEGKVIAVNVRRNEVSVRFGFKDKVDTRDVDSVSK